MSLIIALFPIIVSTILVIASIILVIADLIGNLCFFGLLLIIILRLPVEPAMTGEKKSNDRKNVNDKENTVFLSLPT